MRIAVLSDIHSNVHALNAVFEDIDRNHQPMDSYWCLGDAIGYGLHPIETMQKLRSRVDITHWAAGNHGDLYWEKIDGGAFDEKAKLMMQYNQSVLDTDAELVDFINTLPSQNNPVIYDFIDGFQFILSHNGLQGREKGYLPYPYPWCSQVILPELVKEVKNISPNEYPRHSFLDKIVYPRKKNYPSILLTGHTHIPLLAYLDKNQKVIPLFAKEGIFYYESDCHNSEVVLINPSSVGYPRDNNNKASYLIIDTKKKNFEFVKVDYPFKLNKYNGVLNYFREQYPPEKYGAIEREIYTLQENIRYAKIPGGELPPPDEWIKFFDCEKEG